MTTENKNAPIEVEETTLDDISGGPHFRTWDSPIRHARAETDKKDFSSLPPMEWDNVKN